MNPELEAGRSAGNPIPSGQPTLFRQVHSVTPPLDRAMPPWHVAWLGGRKTSDERKERIREAREQARRLAYELTESDHEAAEALRMTVQGFRSWRSSRHLWSRYHGRSVPDG